MTAEEAIAFAEQNFDWAMQLGLNVFYAAVIMVVAYWVSGRVKSFLGRVGDHKPEIDDTLFTFLGSLAQYLILALALIFVLNRFGVQTTSLPFWVRQDWRLASPCRERCPTLPPGSCWWRFARSNWVSSSNLRAIPAL
jgi:hypothetical protein